MLVLVLSTVLAAEPPGPDTIVLDVELAQALGDGLFASGDPTGALQWYRVARWLQPTGDELSGIQARVGLGLEATGDFAGAADWYTRVEGPLSQNMQVRAGVCRFKSGATTWGTETFDALAAEVPAVRGDVELLQGVLWLEQGDAHQAAEAFSSVPTSDPRSAKAAGMAARAGTNPPLKSPVVAAGLSVVPGMGQMYTGHRAHGWRNLGAAAMLGGGTWWTMSEGLKGDPMMAGMGGALATTAAIGWTANVIGAWKRGRTAAHEARLAHAKEVREAAVQAFPDLPLDPDPAQLRRN